MKKSHPLTSEPQACRTWEHLEDFVREHVQQFIQALLEEVKRRGTAQQQLAA
jgi:hypothetical protein